MMHLSRFGLSVVIISLGLALATGVVWLRGDQVGVTPVEVSPDANAGAVSTGASLRLRFSRPMKPQSVEEHLHLTPAAAGSFQWAGSTVTFTPRQPLRPLTDYTVTLDAGLEEARGHIARQPFSWRFRTRAPLIVALQKSNGPANLWLFDPAGAPARALTRETVDIIDFSLAPDGSRAVYTLQDSPSRTSLRLVDLQTGATTPFATDDSASLSAPAWSPSGDLIVFERRQASATTIANPKLFAARADGGGSNLVYGRGDEVGFAARWSPDGARLAFFDSVKQAIVIFNFTRDRVTIPVQTSVGFAWSPDGQQVVLEDIIAEGNAFRHVLLLADAATGQTRQLSIDPAIDDAAPVWSPDGARLAFTRRPTSGSIGGAQPWLLGLKDGQLRPLAPADLAQETSQIAWSPDGLTLLFDRAPLNDAQATPQLWLAAAQSAAPPRPVGVGANATWIP